MVATASETLTDNRVEDRPSTESNWVVMHDVSWDTYQRLARGRGESRRPRLAFDEGWLEIVSPTRRHDKSGYVLALLIEFAAVEWGDDVDGFLSTTISRDDIEAGFEADQTFYVENAARMREVDELDLSIHPPPDLVIEVDASNDSRRKLRLFRKFSVPEVWRVVEDEVIIYRLADTGYDTVETSVAFPAFTSDVLTRFMRSGRTMSRVEWRETIRTWAIRARDHQGQP